MHRNKHSMLGQRHLIILITLTPRLCEFTSATMHFCVADRCIFQSNSLLIPTSKINTINLNTFKKEKDSNTLLQCKFDTPLPCTTDLFLREEALDRDATCEQIRGGRKLLPDHIAIIAELGEHISQTQCNLIAISYEVNFQDKLTSMRTK